MTVSSNIMMVTGGYDYSIKVWKPHTGDLIKTLSHPESAVNCLCISSNKKMLYSGGYQTIRTFDRECLSNPSIVYDNFEKNITKICCNEQNNWIVSSGEDCYLRIWDTRASKSTNLKFQCESAQNSCFIHPNQTSVFTCGSDGSIKNWDMRAIQADTIKPANDVPVNSVYMNPQATMLAAVDSKGKCYVWSSISKDNESRSQEFSLKHEFDAHSKYGLRCAFSPDSTLLATSSADKTIKIWETSKFSLLSTLSTPKQLWVWDCAFSNDSQYMLSASSDAIARLWHVKKAQVIREFIGHLNPIIAMDFCDETE